MSNSYIMSNDIGMFINQPSFIEPFDEVIGEDEYPKRPEYITRENAQKKADYLKREMTDNWTINPNKNNMQTPLYSNHTYYNKILPNKNVFNMNLIQNTSLYRRKPKHPILGNDNRVNQDQKMVKPFKRFQQTLEVNQSEYLDTPINNQGEVESLKNMFGDYLKEQNLRNKLMFKGAIVDIEILGDETIDYLKFYDKNGYETYG